MDRVEHGVDEVEQADEDTVIGDLIRTDLDPLMVTDSFSDGLKYFTESENEFLPVVNEDRLVKGLITRREISKVLKKLL